MPLNFHQLYLGNFAARSPPACPILEQAHGGHGHGLDVVPEVPLLGHLLDDGVHGQRQRNHRRTGDLLHAKRHFHEVAILGPREAVVNHLGLDLGVERKQVLAHLPWFYLDVAQGALTGLLFCEEHLGGGFLRLELLVALRLEHRRLLCQIRSAARRRANLLGIAEVA